MINVAVTGALGRMGSAITEAVLETDDLELSLAIEAPNEEKIGRDIGELIGYGEVDKELVSSDSLKDKRLNEVDVLIDFTAPKATVFFSEICAKNNIDLVIGTTGFNEKQMDDIQGEIKKGSISAVISPNYSTGINVFWELVKTAVKALESYDAEIVEVHHNNKKDAPSGTAKKTADYIREIRGDGEYVYGREGLSPREKNEIGIHAVRAGDIIGDHTVYLSGSGSGERIEITHRAQSREPFINGALKSTRFIIKQEKGIYGMKDVLGL